MVTSRHCGAGAMILMVINRRRGGGDVTTATEISPRHAEVLATAEAVVARTSHPRAEDRRRQVTSGGAWTAPSTSSTHMLNL
jgi:hypothetical protein